MFHIYDEYGSRYGSVIPGRLIPTREELHALEISKYQQRINELTTAVLQKELAIIELKKQLDEKRPSEESRPMVMVKEEFEDALDRLCVVVNEMRGRIKTDRDRIWDCLYKELEKFR